MAAAAESPASFFGAGITICTLLLSECFAEEVLPFLAAIALDELLDLPLPMIANISSREVDGCSRRLKLNGRKTWLLWLSNSFGIGMIDWMLDGWC